MKLAFWGSENSTPISWLNSSSIMSQTNFNRANNRRLDYNFENTISYTSDFGLHNVNVLLGQGAYLDNNTRMTSVMPL